MRFAPPPANARPVGQFRTEIAALGIEGAEGILQVREPGLVFDVEEVATFGRPRHDVRAPRELEVLVGLVQTDIQTEPAEMGRLHLTHRRVDRVDRAGRERLAASRVQ
jgi:hypothetical protein